MVPLFETIIEKISLHPRVKKRGLQAQITLMDYSSFVGKIAICTINRGEVKAGQSVAMMNRLARCIKRRLPNFIVLRDLKQVETERASVGEIVILRLR